VQCYIQTLIQIDGMLRGWSGAFQHSRSTQTFIDLDAKIDAQLAAFDRWFEDAVRGRTHVMARRALGVRLLSDSEPVALPVVDLDAVQ
jgi:hypothetical protein